MSTAHKEKASQVGPNLVVPMSVQRRARIKPGDPVEFKTAPGVITIVSKVLAPEDEYTVAQRRAIDAQLAAAGNGPFYGPFETAGQAIQFMRREIRVRKAAGRNTRVRKPAVSKVGKRPTP